jgi:putative ABC transport system substrate-binding protein
MRRRDFITLLGGTAAASPVLWPLAARAQQPALPVIGYLSSRSPGESSHFLAAFRQGLGQSGYIEGQNVAIEYRWAEGQVDRLPALAADLVARRVAVIAAVGGTVTGLVAKAATSTISIVFIGEDPVKAGLVASLNRPGGNATGVNVLLSEMEGKRLGLLGELVPGAALIAVLLNPNNPVIPLQSQDVEDAARALGRRVHILHARNVQEIDNAFASLPALKADALLVGSDPLLADRREQMATLARHYRIPAIYAVRDFVLAGGLMSYGTSLPDGYRQLGAYAGRILKGEKPADLPVVQVAKFEFVINLRTAKALGIDVPGALSARADEIIE